METVKRLAQEIVSREGGYVDDPADPGGPTKYGVTLATLRGLGVDNNRDGRVDAADVAALTQDQAVSLFVNRYYLRPHLDLLPKPLQPPVFDMYVNAGATAVKILQRLLVARGANITVDGVIGAETLSAVRTAAADLGIEALANDYSIARRDFYYQLADSRPSSRKYVLARNGGKGGWIRRAEEFLPENLRLTEAQHRARTAHWS